MDKWIKSLILNHINKITYPLQIICNPFYTAYFTIPHAETGHVFIFSTFPEPGMICDGDISGIF